VERNQTEIAVWRNQQAGRRPDRTTNRRKYLRGARPRTGAEIRASWIVQGLPQRRHPLVDSTGLAKIDAGDAPVPPEDEGRVVSRAVGLAVAFGSRVERMVDDVFDQRSIGRNGPLYCFDRDRPR